MIGIYFSGTGNTEYMLKRFLTDCDKTAKSYALEDEKALEAVKKSKEIVFAYPVYYSNLPKIVRDFIEENQKVWRGKKIFIIATMGLFSGDGTGCSARLFKKYGAEITGGLHLKMPDCIGDVKALKKSLKENQEIIKKAEAKTDSAARQFKQKQPVREGLGIFSHMAGLFGQRLWFYSKTKKYSSQLKINLNKCKGCGLCIKLCPMNNLRLAEGKAAAGDQCTMCYRCVSHCPNKAVTLLGNEVYEQCRIERYQGHSEQ